MIVGQGSRSPVDGLLVRVDNPDLLISIADGPEVEAHAKGSRFLGRAFAATDDDDARRALHTVRERYPDATHHCWALRIGPPGRARERDDDDGEPGRTAGAPILRAIDAAELTDVLVVVTRWFGGTKLGKGGLVRGYGSAARAALAAAPRRRTYRTATVAFGSDYDDVGAVEALLAKHERSIVSIDRSFEATPRFSVTLHASAAPPLVRALADATAGRIDATVSDA